MTLTYLSPFGIAFREAAQRTGIEINDDFFDSSCIAISLDDLDAFLDNLQLTLVN